MLSLSKNPPIPSSKFVIWNADQRSKASEARLQARDNELQHREARVESLKIARLGIIAHDDLWVFTKAAKEVASLRMQVLVCPIAPYYIRHIICRVDM